MMRSFTVVCVLLAAGATAAHAQAGLATVDPGMTKAQVVEALGAPAAERSRGSYTYLFYQNGCERECGMADLVTLESDTVIDAIFRAPHRRYAGVSSSPVATTPAGARLARAGGGPLTVPTGRGARETPASMAAEFADLLGNPVPPESTEEPAPAPAEPAARPAKPASVAQEIADLLGTTPGAGADPAPAGDTPPVRQAAAQVAAEPPATSVLPPELAELLGNPAPTGAADTEKPKTPAAAATPAPTPAPGSVLSPEISELLGNPAPVTDAAKPAATGMKPAPSSILGEDITSLLRDPDARPSADASAGKTGTPAAAQPVQEPPRPDTIKSSGGTGTTRPSWPPPRDTAAVRPPGEKPAEQPRPAAPDSTKAKEQPPGRTWTTWPPPPM